jgi:hypothetical protein
MKGIGNNEKCIRKIHVQEIELYLHIQNPTADEAVVNSVSPMIFLALSVVFLFEAIICESRHKNISSNAHDQSIKIYSSTIVRISASNMKICSKNAYVSDKTWTNEKLGMSL